MNEQAEDPRDIIRLQTHTLPCCRGLSEQDRQLAAEQMEQVKRIIDEFRERQGQT